MSLDLFKKIVDECADNQVREMHLQGFGEPFLDKNIFHRIRYAKEKGIRSTILVTNGSLLTSKICEEIVQSGLDRLKISFYGIDKQEYESVHGGIKFDMVKSGIQRLLDTKRKSGQSKPKITLKYIGRLHRFPRFVLQWWPRARVGYARLHNYSYGRKYNPTKSSGKLKCDMVWDPIFQILWDGRVVPCCYDFDGRIILGDLNRQSITEIWQSENYKKFRQAHSTLKLDPYPICKICDKLK
jgi:radical SAM protein with 4Fe4S-binding SPASM domain